MAELGFIHGKLDVKLLILYLMARVAAPIDLPTLADLALRDPGMDYFSLAEAVHELTDTGHLEPDGPLYAITNKGRRHSQITENSLPRSVRLKCDTALTALNAHLRRTAQVRAELTDREGGSCTLRLSLDDNEGSLFSLDLLVGDRAQAQAIADRFQAAPEQIYNALLSVLLTDPQKGDPHV